MKPRATFSKIQREQQKKQRKEDKAERRRERRARKAAGDETTEDQEAEASGKAVEVLSSTDAAPGPERTEGLKVADTSVRVEY